MTRRQRVRRKLASPSLRSGVTSGFVTDLDGVRVPIGARPGAECGRPEVAWVAADGIEVWRWGTCRLKIVKGQVLDGLWGAEGETLAPRCGERVESEG